MESCHTFKRFAMGMGERLLFEEVQNLPWVGIIQSLLWVVFRSRHGTCS